MGFVCRTAGASDVSTQVGVKLAPGALVLIALLTAGASDVSTQVGVKLVPGA
jgi:hypothetical protein